MSELRFISLFSGSSGNCEYIKYKDTEILIDAGKSARCVKCALESIGTDISHIKGIFVTHEHSDHTAGLCVLSRRDKIPVHMTVSSAGGLCELPEHLRTHATAYEETVGDITVRSFAVPHDSACAVGYVIEAGSHKLAVATDMGYLTKEAVASLAGCEYAVVESNYDEEMLRSGPYPESLKERIAGKGGHLSNSEGALLAAVLTKTGAKRIALGHLSAENNKGEKALAAAKAEMLRRSLDGDVIVLSREEVTVIADV